MLSQVNPMNTKREWKCKKTSECLGSLCSQNLEGKEIELERHEMTEDEKHWGQIEM